MVPLQISSSIYLSVNGSEYFFLTENFANAVVSQGQPNVTQKQPGVDQNPEWPAEQASSNYGRCLLRLGEKCSIWIKLELKCFSLIISFAHQLQMSNGKETSPCYCQVAKGIFSIQQDLPWPFHLNLFRLKQEASLWLLHCTDAYYENAFDLEKWTSA